jgi:GT2 family glycosyltransferase
VGEVLSVIVINHRSSRLADTCVRSLLAGSLRPDDVVVVDNESTDAHGGLSDETRAGASVRVVPRSGNPGYAASCNAGAREAQGDTLLFVNADVTVSPDCLRRCLDALHADPSVGIVSPRLVRADGSLDHACHRGLPTPLASMAYSLRLDRLIPWSRKLGRYRMTWLDPLTDHDVEACSGAFLMLSRELLEAVGGWDERYRFYAEDLDLCLRVTSTGRRVRFLGGVTAMHIKGAFSHLGVPDSRLLPEQRAVKQRVRRQVIASHRLFFDEHLRARASVPTRLAIGLAFAMQQLRLEARERLARL